MIQDCIKTAVEGKDLTKEEAKAAFEEIMTGQATEAQIAALIVALKMKGESISEITGAAQAMREVATNVYYTGSGEVLDIVGTGGDSKNAFNVSTASAIVAAGAGCVVAKHGNRSVSSKSGAADVLEALGVKIDNTPEKNSKLLDKTGFAFLYAPAHHPAMKYAAKTRKEIGVRTIFNILGPISNPAKATTYLLGAYSVELAEKLAGVLLGLKVKHALVVNGSGYDEATLTGPTTVFEVENGKIKKYEIKPEQFGFSKKQEKDFSVENSAQSADAIMKILEGKDKGAKRDLVMLNAGLAIYANGKAKSPKEGIDLARASIDSGRALLKLKDLIAGSKQ